MYNCVHTKWKAPVLLVALSFPYTTDGTLISLYYWMHLYFPIILVYLSILSLPYCTDHTLISIPYWLHYYFLILPHAPSFPHITGYTFLPSWFKLHPVFRVYLSILSLFLLC